ncbi:MULTISPECIES: DUF1836 domain-containing protein [Clostridium]|jgi:hypothetical protein|uniref:DUF1836 domain-containing protein n=2 Tax=root TaxID=1 RepID=R9BSU4_9CLOT|nr:MULTISPECIES: DUF1836 domain-containing protein [Clostridium]EOR20082.1 hypothetical protein A500_18617 [Clostridium sartagoforme AAU1]KLE14201.1 hypothetical protein AAT22_17830 [Clostridium sp. C8]
MNKGKSENLMRNILEFHCPRYNELPKVPLYKEQVIEYIENVLKGINVRHSERLITPTMLNNYVKQKVVSPPKDKKYNEKHLAYLIIVCILKQVFTIQEICNLIRGQINTCPIEEAYDFFCVELEKSLKAVFDTRNFSEPSSARRVTRESEVVRSTVMSFSHKIYIYEYIFDEVIKKGF